MKKMTAISLAVLVTSATAHASPNCYLYEGVEREDCERQDEFERRLDEMKRNQEYELQRQEAEMRNLEHEAELQRDRLRKCADPLQDGC